MASDNKIMAEALVKEFGRVAADLGRDFRAKYADALLQVEMRDAMSKITGLAPSCFRVVDYGDRDENTVTFKL